MDFDNKDLKEIPDTQFFSQDIKSLSNTEPLKQDDVGDRCFSLLGGRVIFGLLVGELEDSFLVGLASTLVSDGKGVEGKLLTASPIIRLFKNGVAFMSMPELEHKALYYRHIARLTGMLPEFFNSERTAKINGTIELCFDGEPQDRPNSSSGSAQEEETNPGRLPLYSSTTRH